MDCTDGVENQGPCPVLYVSVCHLLFVSTLTANNYPERPAYDCKRIQNMLRKYLKRVCLPYKEEEVGFLLNGVEELKYCCSVILSFQSKNGDENRHTQTSLTIS